MWLLSPRPLLRKLDLPEGGIVPACAGRGLPCCQGAKGSTLSSSLKGNPFPRSGSL